MAKQRYIKLIAEHWPLLLIILANIIVVTFWFTPFDSFIYFWDMPIVINLPLDLMIDRLTLWVDQSGAPGFAEPTTVAWISYLCLSGILHNIFGLVIGQYIHFSILLNLGGIFIIKLFDYLYHYFGFSSNKKNVVGFLISFFYLFNFFNSLYVYGNLYGYTFYLILPVTLYCYFKSKENKAYFVWYSIAILLQSQTFKQPAFMMLYLLYILIFSCILLASSSVGKVIKHLFVSLIIAACLLMFYLLPLLLEGNKVLMERVANVGGNYVDIYKQFSNLFQVITFNNFYVLANPDFQKYGKWVLFYKENILLQILSSILFISLLSANIYHLIRNYKKIFLINLLLLFFSLLLATAPCYLNSFLSWIWIKIPILAILRAWDNKIGNIYLYVVIFVTFFTIHSINNKKIKYTIFLLFVFLYGIYSYPSVSGSFIFNKDHVIEKNPFGKGVSQKVKIPNEYMELKNYFDKDRFARILVFPRDQIVSSDFFNDGTGYAGVNLVSAITLKETSVSFVGNIEYVNRVISDISKVGYNDNFIKNVNKYGFTHILVRKKYNTNPNFIYVDIEDKENFKDYLNKNYNMIYSTDYFDLYNTDNKIFQVEGNNVYFQKINSIKYKIYMANVNDISKLSFIEGFDENWKLYLNPISHNDFADSMIIDFNKETKTTLCKPKKSFFKLDDLKYLWKEASFGDSHQIENDYANMWYINPDVIKGTFSDVFYREKPDGSIDISLTLFYQPQVYSYVGLLVSLCTLIIVFVFSYCPVCIQKVIRKKD